MTEIIVSRKIGVALDVDGTLIDTNRECYKNVSEAWQHKYSSEFPLTYEQFYSFRPWVKRAEDYFSFSRMMIENGGKMPDNFEKMKEGYLAHPDDESLKELFYRFRKEKIKTDIDGWIAENKLYEGVKEMISAIDEEGWYPFVVTSKDEHSVTMLLSYYGIDGPIREIFDKEYGKREEQFSIASKTTGISMENIITYDDLLPQLRAARSLGMKPVAAPQGYGIKEEIEKAGFPLAFPNQFIEVAKKPID